MALNAGIVILHPRPLYTAFAPADSGFAYQGVIMPLKHGPPPQVFIYPCTLLPYSLLSVLCSQFPARTSANKGRVPHPCAFFPSARVGNAKARPTTPRRHLNRARRAKPRVYTSPAHKSRPAIFRDDLELSKPGGFIVKLLIAAAILICTPLCAIAQSKPCEDLKTEIAKKLDAKGVTGYTLTIVDKGKEASTR